MASNVSLPLSLLLNQAAGNSGKRIASSLPCWFTLSPGDVHNGFAWGRKTRSAFGDADVVGTGTLKRANGAPYHNSDTADDYDQFPFACAESADSVTFDDVAQERSMSRGSAMELRKAKMQRIAANILDDLEATLLAKVFSTSLFSTSTVAGISGGHGVAWGTAGSDPATDGAAIQAAIEAATGANADYAVISVDVLRTLQVHAMTLGTKVYTGAGAVVQQKPRATAEDTLKMWTDTWELPKGIFVARALKNTANRGQAATLAKMVTASAAFHCAAGLDGAARIDGAEGFGVQLGAAPVSLLAIREFEYRGYEDRIVNPHGTQLVGKLSNDAIRCATSAALAAGYVATSAI